MPTAALWGAAQNGRMDGMVHGMVHGFAVLALLSCAHAVSGFGVAHPVAVGFGVALAGTRSCPPRHVHDIYRISSYDESNTILVVTVIDLYIYGQSS